MVDDEPGRRAVQCSSAQCQVGRRVEFQRWNVGLVCSWRELKYRIVCYRVCGMLAFFYPDQDKKTRVSQRPAGRLVSPMLLLPTKSSCVTVCTEYKGRLLLWMVETKINQGTQASSTLKHSSLPMVLQAAGSRCWHDGATDVGTGMCLH